MFDTYGTAFHFHTHTCIDKYRSASLLHWRLPCQNSCVCSLHDNMRARSWFYSQLKTLSVVVGRVSAHSCVVEGIQDSFLIDLEAIMRSPFVIIDINIEDIASPP
jgi:hypothetical protein